MLKHLSTGPWLPYGNGNGKYVSAMAPSPDGNGIILVGGFTEYGYTDSILELKADGQGWVGSWTTLTTKLQYARAYHVVIPVLMEKDICDLSGIVATTAGKCSTMSSLVLLKSIVVFCQKYV